MRVQIFLANFTIHYTIFTTTTVTVFPVMVQKIRGLFVIIPSHEPSEIKVLKQEYNRFDVELGKGNILNKRWRFMKINHL